MTFPSGAARPPAPSPGQKRDTLALQAEELCLRCNVAGGNGADTTGNLPVSEEAAPVAEVLGCRRWSPVIPLLSLPRAAPCRAGNGLAVQLTLRSGLSARVLPVGAPYSRGWGVEGVLGAAEVLPVTCVQ